ncbi:MAG: hypothetical protein ACI9PP_000106 [Halobacteriales archaeon]|jgi:hypothetical protein
MPELTITEEQASYLDDLREAIESDIVGPYGTVHRKDALQYLMDSFGAPDKLETGTSTSKTRGSRIDDTGQPSETELKSDETVTDEPDGDAEFEEEENETEPEAKPDQADDDSDGDDMLNEMMSLLDTHDDKWTEADTEETKYVVDLPDGDTETVQTQDDVRAVLFKHHR